MSFSVKPKLYYPLLSAANISTDDAKFNKVEISAAEGGWTLNAAALAFCERDFHKNFKIYKNKKTPHFTSALK